MLEVTIYTQESLADEDVAPEQFDVDYVSIVNGGTHGPPPLVAPGRERGEAVPTVAKLGDEVLYINTALVPVFTIKRASD